MNGADLLCETLLANGIDTCFANPGTSEMHFVAALDRQPRIRCILGLFEGGVTGMADGYGRMTDHPAATLLHTGPGLANGLANLHNARRAGVPLLNIVGDHATYHLQHDAPLTSDIDSLARPMSHWLGRATTTAELRPRTEAAIAATLTGRGQVATLILPADTAWNPAPDMAPDTAVRPIARPVPTAPDPARLATAAAMLRNGRRTLILLGGRMLRAPNLEAARRIADATGADLMAQGSNARIARGAGRVAIERVPYAVDLAVTRLAGYEQAILIGATAPVAFFAYPGKPGTLLPAGCTSHDLTSATDDMAAVIAALGDQLGIAATTPVPLNARALPEQPVDGPLDAGRTMAIIARHIPENAIIADESVTSGRNFFGLSHGAAPHDFLQLTGGAIGGGIPMATGAAVACLDRKVIGLQADGSGMYTLQALWTQARERLDVVTVILANRRYNILHGELRNVGANAPGENARRMLDLDDPALDWVLMARGMGVEAARAETTAQLADLLAAAMARPGPFLIEAVI